MCRRAVGGVRQLLPLRIPRVYEEPGALPDHGGPGRDQRHQIRTDPRLPAVQVPGGDRACVRLRGLDAGALRLPGAGAPEPQPVGLGVRAAARRTGRTLPLAQLGPQPGPVLPAGTAVRAHAAARRIPVAYYAGPGPPLLQPARTHTRKHLQFAQCAARHVNTSVILVVVLLLFLYIYILCMMEPDAVNAVNKYFRRKLIFLFHAFL